MVWLQRELFPQASVANRSSSIEMKVFLQVPIGQVRAADRIPGKVRDDGRRE